MRRIARTNRWDTKSFFPCTKAGSQRPKRPSTFLREHNPTCKFRTICLNATDKVITASHSAFRDRADFSDRLTKSGGNSDLIDFPSKEEVTNTMLRKRFLKGIAVRLSRMILKHGGIFT